MHSYRVIPVEKFSMIANRRPTSLYFTVSSIVQTNIIANVVCIIYVILYIRCLRIDGKEIALLFLT